jgi:RNA polymerase nonessential primary-like sigma factor
MPSVKPQSNAQARRLAAVDKPKYTSDTVRTYLHEIGRVPLISHEQEICYGKQVQQMMRLHEVKQHLEQTLNRPPTKIEWSIESALSEPELDRILRRGHQAKQKMIEANLRLVVAIAKKYQKRNLEFLDLIQEGSLGLERGVEKFDPTKGYKLVDSPSYHPRHRPTGSIDPPTDPYY